MAWLRPALALPQPVGLQPCPRLLPGGPARHSPPTGLHSPASGSPHVPAGSCLRTPTTSCREGKGQSSQPGGRPHPRLIKPPTPTALLALNKAGDGGGPPPTPPAPPAPYLADLAASAGLAPLGLLLPAALCPAGLLGGGGSAWSLFLPGCLVLPLGLGSARGTRLAPLQHLSTIIRLQTGLQGRPQLHDHKGPRDHGCGREKRLSTGEACGCPWSTPAPTAPSAAPLEHAMLPSPSCHPCLQLALALPQCPGHAPGRVPWRARPRRSQGLTLGTGFLGVFRLLAVWLLHPSWDVLLLHLLIFLAGLGRVGGQSGQPCSGLW